MDDGPIHHIVASPTGDLVVMTDAQARIQVVRWVDRLPVPLQPSLARPPDRAIVAAFARYFDGDWAALSDLRTAASGPRFFSEVWQLLRSIPPGQTRSYGDLARQLGRPGASRAVGAANRSNPISIVVPCHRVIGSDGSLTGYAGGLARKRWLLRHEGASWRERDHDRRDVRA